MVPGDYSLGSVRPVVHLEQGVILTKDEVNSTKLASYWNIGNSKAPEYSSKDPKIGDYVIYEPTPATYEVLAEKSGHTEVQNFATQTGEDALKWRILAIDEEAGKISLVAASTTKDKLTLQGMSAVDNGPSIIDEFCTTLYSNEEVGANARSYNPFDKIYVRDELYAMGGFEALGLSIVEDISFLGSLACYFPYSGDTFWSGIAVHSIGVHSEDGSVSVSDLDYGVTEALLPVVEISGVTLENDKSSDDWKWETWRIKKVNN